MATPHLFTVNALSSSNCAPIVTVPGADKPKVVAGHLAYDGADWQLDSARFSSSDLTVGALAWDTDHLVITTSGFAGLLPQPLVTPATVAAYRPIAIPVDNGGTVEIHVYFDDYDHIVISTEATAMNFNLLVVGD